MTEKQFTLYELNKKILGPISPVGETRTDEKRLENLEDTIKLVDLLLADISGCAGNKSRHEWSMKVAGQKANNFLEDIGERFGEFE